MTNTELRMKVNIYLDEKRNHGELQIFKRQINTTNI